MPFDLTPEEIQTIGDALSLYATDVRQQEEDARYGNSALGFPPKPERATLLSARVVEITRLMERIYRELPDDYENPNIEAN